PIDINGIGFIEEHDDNSGVLLADALLCGDGNATIDSSLAILE
ncbi:unnamed protein product, partial [Rotaria magnacalcarata]